MSDDKEEMIIPVFPLSFTHAKNISLNGPNDLCFQEQDIIRNISICFPLSIKFSS